jgi:hypothetical protein
VKRRRIKILISILSSVIALFLMFTPIVLAYLFTAPVTVQEANGTAYTMIGTQDTIPVAWLIAHGYMDANALDTAMSPTVPHMVRDTTLMLATPLPAYGQVNVNFTTGNTPATSMHIIPGYNGYITIPSAVALDLGNDFTEEADGYVNTATGAGKNIVYKKGSFSIDAGSTTAGEVTATINPLTPITYVASGADAYAANGNVTPALPAGWAANDVFVCLITSDDNVNSTMPAGWTAIDAGTNNGANLRTTTFYRVAVGGDVAPLVTHAAGSHIHSRVSAYRGVDVSGNPFDVTSAASVNVASLTLTFGAGVVTTRNQEMILLLGGAQSSPNPSAFTGAPVPTQRYTDGFGGAMAVLADYTQAVAGASGARSCTLDLNVVSNGYIYALKQYTAGTTLSVNAVVATGEHNVKVIANAGGNTFKLYIDTVEVDSAVLGAASCNVNTNNWLIDQSNVMPYMHYYSHTVGAGLVVHYHPATVIAGTVLPDLEGAAQNGAFTWGANPAGVTMAVGSLVGYTGSFADTPDETTAADRLAEVPVSDWYGDGTITKSATLNNPFRDLVLMVSDNTSLTEIQTWRWYGIGILVVAVALFAKLARGHQGITAIASGAIIALLIAFDATIFPLYLAVLSAGLIIGGLISERSHQI